MGRLILAGARQIFDGKTLHPHHVLVLEQGRIVALLPEAEVPPGPRLRLRGGTLAPGLVDLQVNGGGGVMLSGKNPLAEIATICAAHARLGATSVLPTLITTTARASRAVLAAGVAAVGRVPGFAGLHLEGPHLDPRRPGCHRAEHIRPMTQDDLETLCEARAGLPALMVTLAPASASPEQIARLSAAGVVVALSHSDCTLREAEAAQAAGAGVVTHLFNAMSPLGSREPGLVGAALSLPQAICHCIHRLGVAPAQALTMATRRPAQVIGSSRGQIAPGLPADLVHLDETWQLSRVWQAGAELQANSPTE